MADTVLDRSKLKQTFSDEFNSINANSSGNNAWKTTYYWGDRTLPANKEAEYYSDSSVGVNPFSVDDGILTITASPGSNRAGLPYNSGMINSQNIHSQQYGYFEMRAKLPDEQGFWSAFWMLPNGGGWPPEIDILEHLGQNANAYYGSLHIGPNGRRENVINHTVETPDVTENFHTYGMMWDSQTIRWFFDDVQVASSPTPPSFHVPMYMIANLAVGADGSWPGRPNGRPTDAMEIDFIRAYELTQNGAVKQGEAPAATPSASPAPSGAGAGAGSGNGRGDLVLHLSGDAWREDPRFVVKLDGQAVAGAQSIEASNRRGQVQEFEFELDLGNRARTVTVELTNDAWGGSQQTDRNIYVKGIEVDGDYTATNIAILHGSRSFGINASGDLVL